MYIRVQVKPNAARNFVKPIGKDIFSVSVRPKAENNLANIAVTKLMAKHLNVPHHAIKMWSGRNSPSKKFVINDEYLTKPKETIRYANASPTKSQKPEAHPSYRLLS